MRFRFAKLGVLVLVLLCAGCGDSRRPVYPVRGKVLFDGKPTPDALIIFHPLKDPDPDAPRPLTRVANDGSFTLTTYKMGDGAPAGEYAVTVTWVREVDSQDAPREERREEPNKLPERYSRPATTDLKVEVKKQPNDFPFHLKR